jgi:hypothetical protein
MERTGNFQPEHWHSAPKNFFPDFKNEICINFHRIHLPNFCKGAKVILEIIKGVFLYGF